MQQSSIVWFQFQFSGRAARLGPAWLGSADMMLFCCLVLVLMFASADQRLLKVNPGQDVRLQCPGPRDASVILLEWNRPDLKSDGYVFFYRNKRSFENYQHPSFRGRVQLSDPQMKDGDFSVVLNNVTIDDTGTYECQVITIRPNETTRSEIKHHINLTVTDSAENTWVGEFMVEHLVVLSVTGGIITVFIIIISTVICRKHKDESGAADGHSRVDSCDTECGNKVSLQSLH